MEVIGVVYRDKNFDVEQYEKFLSEMSRFDIVGNPIFSKGEYLLYRALVKVRNSIEKSRINALIEKYKVSVC